MMDKTTGTYLLLGESPRVFLSKAFQSICPGLIVVLSGQSFSNRSISSSASRSRITGPKSLGNSRAKKFTTTGLKNRYLAALYRLMLSGVLII
jgi:hypothetical protein